MKTTLNELKCFVLGHKYVTVTVHNLDKHKKEYWYQCVRCGHRSLFSNLRDTILNKILISKLKVSPLNKTNIMKQIQINVPAWSEEDERRINHIIAFMSDKERIKDTETMFPIEEDVRWLKSIRPQKINPRFPQYENIVDKVFGAGNLETWEREEAEQLVLLAKEELLKDLALTWEDMRELHIIFTEVDVEIELGKTDIKTETLGYYQEVLKRFKAKKGE